MHTNNERIELIKERTAEVKRKRRKRNNAILHTLSVAACMAIIVYAGLTLQTVENNFEANELGNAYVASVLTQNPAIGYILMAILAFSLGVCSTLLFFRINAAQKDKHSARSEEDDEL